MKLRDLLHISTKNIRIYLKRNLLIVMVMGIIFGLIFIINLWFQGLENSYLAYAEKPTEGKVIMIATDSLRTVSANESEPTFTRAEIIEDIESHGGKVLGDTERFGLIQNVILSASLLKNAIAIDPTNAPADAAPVLISASTGSMIIGQSIPSVFSNKDQKYRTYQELRDALVGQTITSSFGAKYHVVGLAPGSFSTSNFSFQQLERRNTNILNPILELIPTSRNDCILVLDNGKHQSWEEGTIPESYIGYEEYGNFITAVFEDRETAYNYFKNGRGAFPNFDKDNEHYSIEVVAGLSPEVTNIFKFYNIIVNIIFCVLGLIAAIVVIFTSIRLIDQDKQNIALYYSLGATRRQIRGIYLCYFLELMFGALIFAFGIASLLVILFSTLNQDMLSIQTALAFSLPNLPHVMWYGVNGTTFIIMVIMLLMAPVCIVVNRKRL